MKERFTTSTGEGAHCKEDFENASNPESTSVTLSASELRYRRLFETAHDGIIVLDGETSTIIDANPSFLKLSELNRDEALGRLISEVGFPDLELRSGVLGQELSDKGFHQFDSFLLTPSGLRRDVEIVASLDGENGSGPIQCQIRDISQRVRAEEEARFQALLLQNIGHAVIATDADGVITHWNRFAHNLYGWSEKEAQGQRITSLLVPELFQNHAGEVMEVLKSGICLSDEMTVQRRDGMIFQVWVTTTPLYDDAGRLVGIVGVSKDISERKRLEADRAQLASIVEFSNDAIISMGLGGEILTWNGCATHLFGYHAEEAVGKPVGIIFSTDDSRTAQKILESVRQGEAIKNLEIVRGGKNAIVGGRKRRFPSIDAPGADISLTLSPIFDAHGTLIGASAIVRDISEQKMAREASKRSEKLYRAITQNFPSGVVYLLDLEGRFFLAEGQGMPEIGIKSNQLVGRSVTDIIEGNALYASLEQAHQEAVRGQETVTQVEYRDHFYSIRAVPVRDEGGEISFVLAISQDISELRQAEIALQQSNDELRASEARFQGIVSNVPGMVYQFQLRPDGTFHFPFASRGSLDLVGVTPEKIRENPQSMIDIIHPEDQASYEESTSVSITAMQPWIWEGRVKLRSGEIKWVQVTSRPRLLPDDTFIWDGLVIDITARKEAEEERDRFFTLSLDMLAVVDSGGYFRRLNPAFELTLGYTTSEILTRHFVDLVHPDDRAATRNEISKLSRGATTLNFVNRCLCSDGSSRWLSWHTVSFEELFYVVAHDISPLIEAETALRRANEDLELRVRERTSELANANEGLRVEIVERQMAMAALRQVAEAYREAKEESDAANKAKSEFLSRMSHELRTPLNAVLGFGQILQTSGLDDDANDSVSQILHGGWHLLDLINEILDISRLETGHLDLFLEAVCLQEVILESCSLVRPLASQRQVSLEIGNMAAEGVYVMADRQRLKQVFINLLSNGIKYNHIRGQVDIFYLSAVNGCVRVGIKDTGPGISPPDQAKLFNAFERLRANESEIEGTGLGLVLSRHLMAAMGGTLDVESALGQGSTFWCGLDEAESPLEDSAETTNIAGAPTMGSLSGHYNILSIEDNVQNQQLIAEILADRPEFVLLSASNGERGLDLARLEVPDLILLDINLPDISGHEILSQLRMFPQTAHIPVIILSADATQLQIDRLLAAGANAYLTKPFSVAKLVACMNKNLCFASGVKGELMNDTPIPNNHDSSAISADGFPPEKKKGVLHKHLSTPLRILVAEDNLINQTVVSHQLRKLGHEPTVFSNGLTAVEAWKTGDYDLILMDCQMPEMNGYEATLEIRRLEKDGQRIPIVALTANVAAGDREKSLAAGMDDYLGKPVKEAELGAAIQRWVTNSKELDVN